jgi:hypothetical protein
VEGLGQGADLLETRGRDGLSDRARHCVFPANTERLIVALTLLAKATPKLEFSTRTLSNAASILCPATVPPPGINDNTGLTHISDGCVGQEQLASTGALFGYATCRAAEIAVDQAIFDEDSAARNGRPAGDPASDEAAVHAIEIEVAQVFLTSAALKLSKGMLMPFANALSIEANTSSQSMVIDLVMVTAPKPPGSRQLISPLSAVLEMAPANVLHGAVRLQGLASSPTPDTQVRLAWA